MEDKKLSKLTTIICMFNAESTIYPALQSLKKSIENGLHIVFIDDASTDRSLEITSRFIEELNCEENCIIVKNERNMGLGFSKAKGIDLSQTEYFTFLDADDWIHKDFYLKISNYFVEKHDVIRTGLIWNIDKKREVRRPNVPIFYENLSPKEMIGDINANALIDFPWTQSGFYRSNFFKTKNIRTTNLRTCEDRIFHWKYTLSNAKVVAVPEVGYFYEKSVNPRALTQTGDVIQTEFVDAYIEVMELTRNFGNLSFHNKAIRQFIALVDFHLANSDRLNLRAKTLLEEKLKMAINSLTKEEFDFAYQTNNKTRQKILSYYRR